MGGQSSTTKPVVPDELRELYRMQTDYAKQNLPQLQALTSDVLRGGSLASNPYVAGLYGTIQQGAENAADQIRMRTPRGPAQDYAVSQAYRQAGQARSQLSVQQRQQVLDRLYQMLSGYNPQSQIGSKTTKPAWSFDMGVGPLSTNMTW